MTRGEVKNSLEYQAGKEALKRYNTQSIDKDFDVISFEEGAEFGYNLAIDKACEWLKEYIEWNDLCTLEDIEQFRKAMESSSSEKPNNSKKGGEV